jgi:hypothetical protein
MIHQPLGAARLLKFKFLSYLALSKKLGQRICVFLWPEFCCLPLTGPIIKGSLS